LSFHKNAIALTKYILDNKTNEEKVNALLTITPESKDFINKKYTKKQDEALSRVINNYIKLGVELGVKGTPTIFDNNGKSLSWVKVLERYGVEVK
jgi:thiol:disulfide interchange protein DsbC